MSSPKNPSSLPEDEEMDPIGLPYPQQVDTTRPINGDDPPHPPFSPFEEEDIPQDPETERIVQPDSPSA